jgi:hypothetical protein
MEGRTLGADADDISGTVTVKWVVDGDVLMLEGDQLVNDFRVRSLEVIWHDSATNEFRSHVYGGGAPLAYRWEIADGHFVHTGLGATYRGSLSEDGSTITGGWRPDPGSDATDESACDVTMRRTG